MNIRNQLAFGGGKWYDRMWSSYVKLNPGIYSDAIATEFKNRMKPDYVENLVPNGGGLNATDWIDSNADEGADRFVIAGSTSTIVTGNGFTGNAQRIVAITAASSLSIPLSVVTGVAYTVTFKHRSNNGLVIRLGGDMAFTSNTGDAKEESFTTTIASVLIFYAAPRAYGGAVAGDWVEIDQITITPVVSENYYNTFGPAGLNKTTADWVYLLTTSGDITSRTINKSGSLLKWNLDGTIVTHNSLPRYTKGTNTGIITMTSTDGWSGVTALAINANLFTGVHPNFNTQDITSLNSSANLLTGRAGSLYATNKMSSANISGNLWTTAMIDAELAYYNTMFAATPPIKNLTLNLSGATMGIPTGAVSNTDYLGIVAKVQAAGFIPSISIRTT